MGYSFVGNHIELDTLPKKFKKLTATRFATVMGLNAWSTPFSAWCEITKTYEEPFEDSIYTVAGKIIEPKICDYLRDRYFMDIKSPTDVYGPDYFRKTWGDFFPGVEVLGGMWDFLGDDFVVEVKTTKKSEDWVKKDSKGEIVYDSNGDVIPDPPIYYKLQACLYAYLLGFDDVVMTCTFLNPADYPVETKDGFDETATKAFIPTIKNTIIHEFKVSEEFPNFKKDYVDPAMKFWREHVLTGISPDFDEKKDADILKALRKNVVDTPTDLTKLIKEGDKLKGQIDRAEAKIAEKKKRLKEIDEAVKKALIDQFRDGDKNVQAEGTSYIWNVRKDETKSFDKKKFDADHPGMYDEYVTSKPKYVLTKSEKE